MTEVPPESTASQTLANALFVLAEALPRFGFAADPRGDASRRTIFGRSRFQPLLLELWLHPRLPSLSQRPGQRLPLGNPRTWASEAGLASPNSLPRSPLPSSMRIAPPLEGQ